MDNFVIIIFFFKISLVLDIDEKIEIWIEISGFLFQLYFLEAIWQTYKKIRTNKITHFFTTVFWFFTRCLFSGHWVTLELSLFWIFNGLYNFSLSFMRSTRLLSPTWKWSYLKNCSTFIGILNALLTK